MLEKEKRKKTTFTELKGKLLSSTAPSKRRVEVDFRATNAVIFGSRLNQVTALLGAASDETQTALLRIYWASGGVERRQMEGQEYSGSDMLLNLHRYYI